MDAVNADALARLFMHSCMVIAAYGALRVHRRFHGLFAYTSPMNPLTSKRRSELRAEAHKLSPIVIIGDKGLTDEVMAEIDRSLTAHELIKVRATTAERDARDVWMEAICEKLGAHPVQQIGKVLVLFRENPKEEARATKREARAEPPAKKPSRPPRLVPRVSTAVTRNGRPRSRTPSPRPASEPRRRRPRTSQ
jgi:RNA-binding protein